MEDDQGYLWIATNTGVNRFDPTTERFTRYLHDPNNPNSIGGAYVTSIARDNRGYLWFGTEDSGLDKFDPATEPSLITAMTVMASLLGGSLRLSRIAMGKSGSLASAACSI